MLVWPRTTTHVFLRGRSTRIGLSGARGHGVILRRPTRRVELLLSSSTSRLVLNFQSGVKMGRPLQVQGPSERAGDRDRTDDVQLGKVKQDVSGPSFPTLAARRGSRRCRGLR